MHLHKISYEMVKMHFKEHETFTVDACALYLHPKIDLYAPGELKAFSGFKDPLDSVCAGYSVVKYDDTYSTIL